MMYLNVGNKWDFGYLKAIIALNKKYRYKDIQVGEMYGDITTLQFGGVRPLDRIPTLAENKIKSYITACYDAGIEINYTLNKSCWPKLIQNKRTLSELKDFIYFLEKLGVTIFTVYSPYILENVKLSNRSIFEVSTIHNNSNPTYLASLRELNPRIAKICLPIYMNKNLSELGDFLRHNHYPIVESIVNEFCVSHGNICLYRAECYNLQSHGKTTPYPFNRCSRYREMKANGAGWLKAPFILPQWLKYFRSMGLRNFKITGRTHPKESILRVIEMYMEGNPNVSLEKLWGTGLPGQGLDTPMKIPVRELVKIEYLQNLAKKPDCKFEVCGHTCKYCDYVVERMKG